MGVCLDRIQSSEVPVALKNSGALGLGGTGSAGVTAHAVSWERDAALLPRGSAALQGGFP